MSIQVIAGRHTVISTNNPVLSTSGGTSQTISTPMPVAGSFTNYNVKLTTAPGVGNTRTFTLHKNDSATTITLTISGTATTNSDTTHSVSYSAGDTLRWVLANTGSPAATQVIYSLEFTPTTPDVSVYGWSSAAVLTNGFAAPFQGEGFVTAQFPATQVVACPGTITDLRWRVGTAPGGVTSRTATIFLNNVAQDGTGGTPNTTTTITGAATSAAASFSLAVVAGDVVTVKQTISGVPAGITWSCGAIALLATFPNQYQFSAVRTGSTTTTKFQWPVGQGASDSATETDVDQIGGTNGTSIGGMYVVLSGAPSAGKSWTLTLRKNGGDTGLAVTVADAATTGFASVSPEISLTASDTWSIKVTSSGSPGAPSADREVSLLNGTIGGPAGQPMMRRWGGSIWPMGGRRIGRGW